MNIVCVLTNHSPFSQQLVIAFSQKLCDVLQYMGMSIHVQWRREVEIIICVSDRGPAGHRTVPGSCVLVAGRRFAFGLLR